jgi:CHAD domain-containing protein
MSVTSTDDRELEWQFDALDLRPVARWLAAPNGWGGEEQLRVSPGGSFSQVDLYLDTDDWRFHRAGYALRIRRVGRRRGGEATLKGLDSAASDRPGLRSRRELSEHLETVDPDAPALAGGIVGRRVRAVAGRKPLLPLFEVRTRRRTFVVEANDAVWAELALDETAIHPPDGAAPARLRRVEIETSDAAHAALASFVERLRSACALQPAGLSKYEAGLLSADLRPWGPERFGSTSVDPEMTIGAVALAVLRRHFAALLAHEPGTRLGDDSEELHDMRVASRRLRAALSLFADVLPESVLQVREELRWVGETLGSVRDLDVQVEQLDEWLGAVPEADREALAELRSLLVRQRSAARAAMLEALDSRRYEAFAGRFGRVLRARPQRRADPGSAPARAVAPDLIERRFRSVRKAAGAIGPESPPADYHRLRIRGKRLRYALEFLGDLYPGHTQPLIRRLVALQDLLGEHQDAEVAIARLRGLVREGDELRPETVFAMGAIAERYRQRAAALRAEFPAARARVTGRQWKALRDVLEEQRPAESERAAGDEAPG